MITLEHIQDEAFLNEVPNTIREEMRKNIVTDQLLRNINEIRLKRDGLENMVPAETIVEMYFDNEFEGETFEDTIMSMKEIIDIKGELTDNEFIKWFLADIAICLYSELMDEYDTTLPEFTNFTIAR